MSDHVIGYRTLSLHDKRRNRPLLIDIWYPASESSRAVLTDYNPGSGYVARDADHIDKQLPLILLSHGAFGAARNYTWITEHLAGSGYIVAGLSHFGESYVYGPENVDPFSVLNPRLRTGDCSYALDALASGNELKGAADFSRIGAIGHSSGGATVLELGGAGFNPYAMLEYCSSPESVADKGCEFARQFTDLKAEDTTWYSRDERISAIAALDPALGPGHPSESLKAMHIPVYIAGAVSNDFIPYRYHAGRYAGFIPGVVHTRLDKGEGHFIFLNESDSQSEIYGVPIYSDMKGISRREVHNRLKKEISGFFDIQLAK